MPCKNCHGGCMPLCLDCGTRSRSLPLAGTLQGKREASKGQVGSTVPRPGPWLLQWLPGVVQGMTCLATC